MPQYSVTASVLNLRSTPSSSGGTGNIIGRLKKGEIVEVIDGSMKDWYKIRCINWTPVLEGYAASSYLKAVSPVDASLFVGNYSPVNLPANSSSRRNNHGAWQYPLSESEMPRAVVAALNLRVDSMHQIVQYLQVDKSERYARDQFTYCNIYAYDYCYLCNVFLPRVWWIEKSLLEIAKGVKLLPLYDLTVTEIQANKLYSWLEQWGNEFKWTRTYSLDELQSKVNEGRVGVICGTNINPLQSGHICCVIPERDDKVADRQGGVVICPLLSQAGAKNLEYYNNNRWWLLSKIKEFGFWYN